MGRRGAHWITLHIDVRDDEGTPVRVDLDAVRRASASLPMPERAWLFYSVCHPRWVLRVVGVAWVMVVLGVVGMAFSLRTSFVHGIAAAFALPFPLVVLWGCFEWYLRLRRARKRYLPACRAARVCAGCHYSLDAVPADALGLTRCPECGLAWRVSPPASPGDGATPSPTAPRR